MSADIIRNRRLQSASIKAEQVKTLADLQRKSALWYTDLVGQRGVV